MTSSGLRDLNTTRRASGKKQHPTNSKQFQTLHGPSQAALANSLLLISL